MGKPRQKAMRKGHMRRFASNMINGGSTVNAMGLKKLYYNKNIDPTMPLPTRQQIRKSDPSDPMPEIKQFMTRDGKIDKDAFDEALLAWRKRQDNPTISEPIFEKLVKHNPGHFGLTPKPDIEWYHQVCIDSPLNRIEMWFAGFKDSATHYFKWLDKISGTERTSFTLTKSTALRFRENGLKGIPWK